MASEVIDKSRRFYENKVAPLIREKFPEYEGRIAVGLSGEGSDCFGFDDFISRDHDFGTGVCLWVTEEDFHKFGRLLSIAYNELVDSTPGANLTERLRERRGVMTINGFFSNILVADIDAESGVMTDANWREVDHACLATAVNGEVFRDDLGIFTAFRETLLNYYPDWIWKEQIANYLHDFSATLQVNYSRCMARKDTVAAEICKVMGIQSAMELFFLLKRVYPPYYKWTFRALKDLDRKGTFASVINELADTPCSLSAWEYIRYSPVSLNMSDRVVVLAERLAESLAKELHAEGLIADPDPYLEKHVDTILKTM